MKVAIFFCSPAIYNGTDKERTIMENKEIKQMLADLVWLNALIATELIQVTENTSAILRKAPPPDSCLEEHNALRATALAIAEKYRADTSLARHLGNHQ